MAEVLLCLRLTVVSLDIKTNLGEGAPYCTALLTGDHECAAHEERAWREAELR